MGRKQDRKDAEKYGLSEAHVRSIGRLVRSLRVRSYLIKKDGARLDSPPSPTPPLSAPAAQVETPGEGGDHE
jgi:hypothetical protein